MERVALLTRHWVATKAVSDGCQGTVSPKPHERCSRGSQGQHSGHGGRERQNLQGSWEAPGRPSEHSTPGQPTQTAERASCCRRASDLASPNEGSRKAPRRRWWHEPWHPGTGNRHSTCWCHITSRALCELSGQKPPMIHLLVKDRRQDFRCAGPMPSAKTEQRSPTP